ncbi:MAG: hypothetical protein COB30_015765 [Ectothiorhodospiraceae bacterium]|nr:hypothetical protein [Ectothiorhodospiraceae bacterium]
MNWVNSAALSTGSQLTSVGNSGKRSSASLLIQSLFQTRLPTAVQIAWKRCIRQMKNTAQHAFDDHWLYDSKPTTAACSETSKTDVQMSANRQVALQRASQSATQSSTQDVAQSVERSVTRSVTQVATQVDSNKPAVVANVVENGAKYSRIECHQTESRLPSWRPKGTITEVRRYSCAENTHGDSENKCRGNADVEAGDRINELQTLLPALAGFCRDRWLVLIAPPHRPDIAALTAAGIDPSRVLIIHAHARHHNSENDLQIVEAALRSGTCGAVVAWLETCDATTLVRLKKSAETGHAWGVMFRGIHTDAVEQPSASEMTNESLDKVTSTSKINRTCKPKLSIIQKQAKQEMLHSHAVVDIWQDASQPAAKATNKTAFFRDKPAQIEMAIG